MNTSCGQVRFLSPGFALISTDGFLRETLFGIRQTVGQILRGQPHFVSQAVAEVVVLKYHGHVNRIRIRSERLFQFIFVLHEVEFQSGQLDHRIDAQPLDKVPNRLGVRDDRYRRLAGEEVRSRRGQIGFAFFRVDGAIIRLGNRKLQDDDYGKKIYRCEQFLVDKKSLRSLDVVMGKFKKLQKMRQNDVKRNKTQASNQARAHLCNLAWLEVGILSGSTVLQCISRGYKHNILCVHLENITLKVCLRFLFFLKMFLIKVAFNCFQKLASGTSPNWTSSGIIRFFSLY